MVSDNANAPEERREECEMLILGRSVSEISEFKGTVYDIHGV